MEGGRVKFKGRKIYDGGWSRLRDILGLEVIKEEVPLKLW
jgi:hypothetical protein